MANVNLHLLSGSEMAVLDLSMQIGSSLVDLAGLHPILDLQHIVLNTIIQTIWTMNPVKINKA